MIYSPSSLPKNLHLHKLPVEHILHDGINYTVYRSGDSVVKRYQGSAEELCRVMQRVEQEAVLSQQSPMFIPPSGYQVEKEWAYVRYEVYKDVCSYIREEHEQRKKEEEEEQELYDELVGDNLRLEQEVVFSRGRLRVMMIETLFSLYELESQGIVLTNIKLNNAFLKDGTVLLFQDLVNRSCYHELTLEEYLLDIPKRSADQKHCSAESIRQLATVFLSLATMTDLESVDDFDEYASTVSSHSQEIVELLLAMVRCQFYHQVLHSPQYLALVNMLDPQTASAIHAKFHVQPKLDQQNALRRIEAKRLEQTDFWSKHSWRNLNVVIPTTRKFAILSTATAKTQHAITALEVVDGSLFGVTYTGCLVNLELNQVVSQVSKSTLHCIKHFARKICVAGEDKIVHVYDTKELDKHGHGIYAMAKTPQYLITGDNGGVVIVWNRELEFVRIMQCHSGRVNDIKFKTSREFYTCSEDKSIKLWDVEFKQSEVIAWHCRKVHFWEGQLFALGESLAIYQSPKMVHKAAVRCSHVQQFSSEQLLLACSGRLAVFSIKHRAVEHEVKLHLDSIADFKLLTAKVVTVGFDKIMKTLAI